MITDKKLLNTNGWQLQLESFTHTVTLILLILNSFMKMDHMALFGLEEMY